MENEENIEVTVNNDKKDMKLEVCTEGVFSKVPIDVVFDILWTSSRFPKLGDHLCVIGGSSSVDKDIWVMKEFVVHTSWAKEYVFELGVSYTLCHGYHQVLELMCMGIIKPFNTITIHNLKNERVWADPEFPIYMTGSLFSPKSVGNNQRGENI
ncbi:hypothetical protein IFM89_017889 [Coptis chinensis]|uniref:Uncharacterized protein n=1 Tax=Coptis chinensis TaxID=261450 RepID=A0A835I0Z4_9MAGN|nr:hypothetical protein IFM89_017889 [Coptis chinensis]